MTGDATGTRAMTRGALDGVRVLDLTTYLPGPYASMLLGDLGADVIQIEPPVGDPGRSVPPQAGGSSALHQWVARNKRSVALDLKNQDDYKVFARLARNCDVVLEGFTSGTASRLGVGYGDCHGLNEQVIYCSISASGSGHASSAAPGHDINALARSGFLDQARDGSGTPVAIGPPIADISCGLHAAVAILAALRHRDRTGEGQLVEISLLSSALALAGPQLVKALAPTPLPRSRDHNLGADPAYHVYRTADGKYVSIGALEPKFWERLCRVLELPELEKLRQDDPPAAIARLQEVFGAAERQHWDDLLGPAMVCYAPVNGIDDVATDPVVVQSGELRHYDENSGQVQLRNPIRMTATPAVLRSAAPHLSRDGSIQWQARTQS
jgi:crotonobetainyl-CoA:carnitine CoA-transferase CaiB-like acyl-CoA transferase